MKKKLYLRSLVKLLLLLLLLSSSSSFSQPISLYSQLSFGLYRQETEDSGLDTWQDQKKSHPPLPENRGLGQESDLGTRLQKSLSEYTRAHPKIKEHIQMCGQPSKYNREKPRKTSKQPRVLSKYKTQPQPRAGYSNTMLGIHIYAFLQGVSVYLSLYPNACHKPTYLNAQGVSEYMKTQGIQMHLLLFEYHSQTTTTYLNTQAPYSDIKHFPREISIQPHQYLNTSPKLHHIRIYKPYLDMPRPKQPLILISLSIFRYLKHHIRIPLPIFKYHGQFKHPLSGYPYALFKSSYPIWISQPLFEYNKPKTKHAFGYHDLALKSKTQTPACSR